MRIGSVSVLSWCRFASSKCIVIDDAFKVFCLSCIEVVCMVTE